MTDALDAALAYARAGLPVLPLEAPDKPTDPAPRRGKAPALARGVHAATTDEAALHALFRARPGANVGIAVPPGLVVVDIDPRNDGHETAADLAKRGHDLPDTLTAETGGGGWHLLYRVPEGVRLPGKLGPGIDVKQPGGYIVAAPSIHPDTGEAYRWIDEAADVAPAPAWLLELDRGAAATEGEPAAPDRELRPDELEQLDRLAEAVEPHFERGCRHNVARGIAGHLRNSGWPQSAAEYVVAQLPSEAPEKRLGDVARAFAAPVAAGWSLLAENLSDDGLAAVEACDVRPGWVRDTSDRIERRQAERAAREQQAQAALEERVAEDPFAGWGNELDLTKDPEPLRYYVPGLGLAAGKVSAISGYAGTGKGPLLDYLALCLATGRSFLGHEVPRAVPVVLGDFETGRLLVKRLRRLAEWMGVDLGQLRASGMLRVVELTPPFDAEDFARIKAICEHNRGRGAVLIDSYTSAMAGSGIASKDGEYAELAFALGVIARDTDNLILFNVHERKGQAGTHGAGRIERVAGTQELVGAMQTIISVERPDDDDRDVLEVSCSRAPENGFAPFKIRWLGDADKGEVLSCEVLSGEVRAAYDDASGRRAPEIERADQAVRIVEYLERIKTPATVTRIRDGCMFPRRADLALALRALVEGRLLTATEMAAAGNGGVLKPFHVYALVDKRGSPAVEALEKLRALAGKT